MGTAPIRIEDAAQQHINGLTAQGMKPATVKSHQQTLTAFLTESGNIYLKSVTGVHVERFFTANHQNWGASTRNLHLVNLRRFFETCRARRWVPRDWDPTYGWRNQKVRRAEKARIPLDDFPGLLDSAPHPRDRAIVALGLFLFLRTSEITALTIGDLNLEEHQVKIFRCKTEEEDTLPMSLELEAELRRYLAWYQNTAGPLQPGWYVTPKKLPNQTRRNPLTGRLEVVEGDAPLVPNQAIGKHPYRAVRVALERAGYGGPGEGGHTLRRSGARALFDTLRAEGYDGALQRVRAMLGHKSSIQTETYLGIDLERRQRNELIAGKAMFPQLGAKPATIHPLKAVGE